ncbi:MAG TPA: hypothetical protein VL098_06805 [Flavipsychrobacter sp.]|nr:hypothetical protein [Flavipsychrobacter sp.]
MKWMLTAFIALGLTLSMTFGVKYHCEGPELFPTYYGSPFVFMKESLGSSMEFHYSIVGLTLNVVIWSLLLTLLRLGIFKVIKIVKQKKAIKIAYSVLAGFLLFFSSVTIVFSYIALASGFGKHTNYWYWNLDREAKEWGMICEGKWGIMPE